MRARVPGKVVLSGAYAVLRGAPAIVAAVDRHALADDSAPADRITPEVARAIQLGMLSHAPAFDSSAQREHDRKLGLGSSAAILVASLYALNPGLSREQLFQQALMAHREAQGGGSGVDVAASVYGGVLGYRLDSAGTPTLEPLTLPDGLCVEVWSSPTEARTSELIERVTAAERQHPERAGALFERLCAGSEAALGASRSGDRDAFLAALGTQLAGLDALGTLAGVPIVTEAVRALGEAAATLGAVVLPAGAGGGDVALWLGPCEPDRSVRERCRSLDHRRLALSLGAEGARLEPA